MSCHFFATLVRPFGRYIVFARDNLVSSSHKQKHIAQHLNEFRQASVLTLKRSELLGLGVIP
jgi:hypothetical protein